MRVPTQGEQFAKLLEHLRLAQDDTAMLAHLTRAQGGRKDDLVANGWLAVHELLKHMTEKVTSLAQGKLQ